MKRFFSILIPVLSAAVLLAACSGGGGGGAPAVSVPSAPSNLAATAASSSGIDLFWSDTSNNEDGFRIERGTDGVNFTEIGTVAANTAAYSDTGLTAATTYYYRVRSYNSAGNSVYSNTADATAVILGSVAALYGTNGAGWNEYVRNDGTGAFTATDTACNAATDTACLHGGELRAVEVTGKTSCTGLTASDALGAFDWVCDASSSPVRMVSTGLKDGKNLSDLLDFDTPGWKQNSVTVNVGGTAYLATGSTAWWSNPVVVDNDGGSLDTAGAIYLATNPTLTTGYTINASRVGFVGKPGVIIDGPAAASYVIQANGSVNARDFLWLEGTVQATGDNGGILLNVVRFSVLRNVKASNATYYGVDLYQSSNNTLSGITASNNGSSGVYVASYSKSNTLSGITASNNGNSGVFVSSYANNNTFHGVTASNNAYYGVYLTGNGSNTLIDVTAANNGTEGVELYQSSNNTLSGVTAVNNGSRGVYIFNSSNNTVSGITSANNGAFGFYLDYSSYNFFTGPFKVGSNGTGDCSVTNGTQSGLIALGYTCYTQAPSDATITAGRSLASSFIGNVITDDTVNTSDTSGVASAYPADPAAFDWLGFQNAFRGWGRDGALGNTSTRGRWTSGTGRIWDWSLLSGDTVIKNALTVPNGDNTLTHRWDGAPATNDNAGCNAMVPGSAWNSTDGACETTLLRNAVEVRGDGIGNDNALCESGETCLYTPDIASYQGHGSLVSAGTFTNGTIAGVTLLKYGTNGR